MCAKPNIVLITCHDLGRFLHCYGVPSVNSPHLDQLAQTGVQFNQVFATAPQCSPSRAALFTGRYPHANGMLGLTNTGGWDLHPEERHLSQILKEHGYRTGLVGIYHETLMDPKERLSLDDHRGGFRGEEVSDEAIKLLEEYAGEERPFYMEIGYFEPHRVWGAETGEQDYWGFIGDYMQADAERGVSVPPYIKDTEGARQEVAELQGAVSYVDGQIGRVLRKLEQSGLDENTLVVFTTDHGIALPRAKCSLYDPGLEIALLVRLPSRGWSGGKQIDGLVSNLDICPTLLDAAGIPIAPNVHGESLAAMMEQNDATGKPPGRDCIYAEMTYHDYYDPRRCIRTHEHKCIVNFTCAPAFMDPSQSWDRRSTTVVPEHPALTYHRFVELYDLTQDPHETNDVAEDPDYADVRQSLLQRLFQWMERSGDPLLKGAVDSPFHNRVVSILQESFHQGSQ